VWTYFFGRREFVFHFSVVVVGSNGNMAAVTFLVVERK